MIDRLMLCAGQTVSSDSIFARMQGLNHHVPSNQAYDV
jgi:hypothetical protein